MTGDVVILGLDISTTTVGWSLVSPESFSFTMGYIPLSGFGNLYDKAQAFEDEMTRILQTVSGKRVIVVAEEDLMRFTRGKSTAHTLRTLSRFNGMVTFIMFRMLKDKPVHVNATEARSRLGFKHDKKDKKRSVKQQVHDWLCVSRAELRDFVWPTKKLASGPRKGQVIKLDECCDMSDAYVMSLFGALNIPRHS
jgi:hypothetical protein